MIYNFDVDTLHLMIGIFAAIIIGLTSLGIYMVVYAFKKGFELNHGGRVKFMELPWLFKLIFCIPLAIVIVFSVSLIYQEIGYISYEVQMNSDNASVIEGDIVLISHEEQWYRGDFSGYSVVIEVNGEKYEFSNSFPLEVLNTFEEGKRCKIQYGYLGELPSAWYVECLEE